MATIKVIVDEPERGCGFRKAGGLYLIGGTASAPCGKLPLKLTVCPTCHAGIKPTRGWTWIDAKALFGRLTCGFPEKQIGGDLVCSIWCVLRDPPEHAGLLWIGEQFYKTPADFMREGAAQGISRRISALPTDFKVGETWVLLAHRKTIVCKNCSGSGLMLENKPVDRTTTVACRTCDGEGYHAGIFTAFRPERIEYIVKGSESEEELARMEKRGITLVALQRTVLGAKA